MEENQELKPWNRIIKEMTEEQVITVLNNLGSPDYKKDKDNNLVFRSVCHEADSYKLCYYSESHEFFCYKEWEKFNIFTLVMRVLDKEFNEALRYVCDLLEIEAFSMIPTYGFVSNYSKADWDFFNKYLKKDIIEDEKEETYNANILNLYSDMYYQGWINENISIKSMKKFNIRFDIVENRIIIPHYDKNGNLVGIRCRNLDENSFAKYCPISIENCWYSHSLANHLYGLDKNKEIVKKLEKVMVCESEKSCMQAQTYFPENNFVVACCGSNISNAQIKLLLESGVSKVQLGFDMDFSEIGNNQEYLKYRKKILRQAKKLVPYFTVYNICDCTETENIFYKYSPTDFPKEKLLTLMKNKELITSDKIEEELPTIEAKLKSLERGENKYDSN